MNSFIETLNQWGGIFLSFAWPMLWQSSLLIVILFAFDFLFRHKLRASIRYALWLVVLVKLCVPPTLALPTSPAWWLHKTPPPMVIKPASHYTVTYDDSPLPQIPQVALPTFVPPKPVMNLAAWLLVISISISSALFLWLLVCWWQITRQVYLAATSERLTEIANEAQKIVNMKFTVQVRLTTNSMSPAVCGLFRLAILIPQSLVENFSDEQLRAVLLHELIHLRRRDVWLNFLQTLLQIFYWWHPLVWLANARIRRVREEAVDDAVMLALRDEAETYAPTLLEVAKLALNRPLASLGLVGILESRNALRQRIERLLNFRAPKKTGLTFLSLCGIIIFSAVAVPMGGGPSPAEKQVLPAPPVLMPAVVAQNTNVDTAIVTGILSDPNFRAKLHALEQRTGVEILAEPEVTTTSSGRGINRITMASISAPLSEFVSASSNQGALTHSSNTNNFDAKSEADRLVQDGKLLYEMGKFAEAEAKLKAALALDSENAAAKYYLGLIWSAHQDPKLNQTKSGRQNIVEKLERIRLDQFGPFEGLSLGEVVSKLVNATGISISMESGVMINQPVNLHMPLKNISVLDALDAVILQMDQPIKYSILDDGVVFSLKDQTPVLFMRTFRVDANTFAAVLRKQTGLQSTNVSMIARSFFSNLGVDFNSPPGKAVFYNDGLGMLFVRATQSDLDTVERAIMVLNQVPPQIHIKARFFEMPKGTVANFGSFLNSTNAAKDTFTGILNATNAKVFLRLLESRKGLEILAEPEVTTLSGRQTVMRATQIITVITNFALQDSPTNGSSSIVPQTSKSEIGPILDVVPYVLSDGYTINLTLTPSLTEFLGYDKPPDEHLSKNDPRVQLPMILPKFSVRQVTATLNLWDNQAVVIGGLPEKKYVNGLPSVGKLKTGDNELLVFITATIVDPAGNRIHSDNDLPFAQKGIPPQPPQSK